MKAVQAAVDRLVERGVSAVILSLPILYHFMILLSLLLTAKLAVSLQSRNTGQAGWLIWPQKHFFGMVYQYDLHH